MVLFFQYNVAVVKLYSTVWSIWRQKMSGFLPYLCYLSFFKSSPKKQCNLKKKFFCDRIFLGIFRITLLLLAWVACHILILQLIGKALKYFRPQHKIHIRPSVYLVMVMPVNFQHYSVSVCSSLPLVIFNGTNSLLLALYSNHRVSLYCSL